MCGLDVGCHLWAWVGTWPWWVHAGLGLMALLALWGALERVWNLAKGIGGWKAALGAVGALVLILAAVWPRKARSVATDEIFPDPDPKPVRVVRRKARRPQHRETVQEWFRRATGQD